MKIFITRIKTFIKQILGITLVEDCVIELNKSLREVEQQNNELNSFIQTVFPSYWRLNEKIKKHQEFKRKIYSSNVNDPLIYKVIEDKEQEIRELINECINDNSLNFEDKFKKIAEEEFKRLLNKSSIIVDVKGGDHKLIGLNVSNIVFDDILKEYSLKKE